MSEDEVPDHCPDVPLEGEQTLRQRKLMSCAKETFDNASRMLRRKIPCTGHLMTPSRLWLKKIPTQECDVVLMFPSGTQDATLMWLLSRLRDGTPGLVVLVRHHVSSDSYGFYLTAPFNVLLKASEELHLPKTLSSEYGGGLKEFVQQEESCFEGIKDETSFFTTQERQWLVLHLLQTLRAGAEDEVAGLKFIEGQAIVPKCVAAGVISQVFPLHDPPALEQLQKSWVQTFFHSQPIDSVCDYFGVKIAMYFAWLGHYTTALIVPAIVGFIFWIGFCGRSQATEDIGYVLFSFFNVLWASIYVEAWKRYSAELAYRWGTLDQRDELLMEPRPLFTGTLEVSPVTGRLDTTYPTWKRNVFRYFVSIPIISLCLAIVFFVMICFLQLQEWWDAKIVDKGYLFCLSYLPKILLAIVITLMDDAYYKVACWLNDQGRLFSWHLTSCIEVVLSLPAFLHLVVTFGTNTSRVLKSITTLTLASFVNSFLSLFYIAFYLQDQEKLKEQLAALLIARQVIGNLKESALPYVLEQLRLAKLSFDMFGALSPTEAKKPLPCADDLDKDAPEKSAPDKPGVDRNISQAELESSLFKYDGTFDDHLEIFIQLGYVVLFSSAFPMAAVCAFVNNLIEIRSDAFKLSFIFQRPFGQRVSNIGTWQNAIEVMGLIAVLVNCALIGLSGQVHRMFPEMSTTQNILLIVALEHIMLTLRFIISCAIPNLPDWVATEMAKIEFARREACRRLSSNGMSSAPDSATQPPSGLSIGRFMVLPTNDVTSIVSEPEVIEAVSKKSTPISEKNTPSPVVDKVSRPASEETLLASEENAVLPLTSGLPSPGLPRPLSQRTRDFLGPQGVESYHLTIGPHGVDWVKRLEVARKTSEPQIGGGSGEDLALHRSTDCIVTSKELSASSDSDLLRSAPPWAAQPRQKFRFSPEKDPAKDPLKEPSPSESSRTLSSQEEEAKSEEWATKKIRVKQSLVKRARSVAMFSLKLKERRAREAAKEADKKVEADKKAEAKKVEKKWGTTPQNVGGELSCIPIEKLISVDDVALDLQRRKNNLH